MIIYLDTSAFVPLLIEEASSASCHRIWSDADVVLSTRLLYVESISALRRAGAENRVPEEHFKPILQRLDQLWQQMRVIEIDAKLMEAAGSAAWRFGLRGYDAVHCAAAALLGGDENGGGTEGSGWMVAASGDRDLLAAWHELGMLTFEPA